MRVAEHVAHELGDRGVTHAFQVAGGTIAHLLDALERSPRTQLVSVRHEQAAAFAADGFARVTGVPGVALATSGPGATNLLTGVAGCHFDSVPAVFLTGQVRRDELTGDRGVRQQGFQETDVVAMARPVTKAAWQATSADDVPRLVREAFGLAASGRPGPVLVDVPSELQSQAVPAAATLAVGAPAPVVPDEAAVEAALEALTRAERPLVLIGGGLRASGARDRFRAWIERAGVPVVHSLHGVDALPASSSGRVGMIGTYGNRWANLALGRCDVLLVLGSRLDIRQTGADVAFFADREIHQIDADPAELGNNVAGAALIHGDLGAFLDLALAQAHDRAPVDRPAWTAEIVELRSRWPDTAEQVGIRGIEPNGFMHALSAVSAGAAAYVLDVGQHQMWAAQSLDLTAAQRCLTSGGMGAMGYALPAAIGASLGSGGAPVVMIAGDGGFQLNLQELQTVAHHGLPLKLVVIDNGAHGMVRQFQASYFERRFAATEWGYSAPDFARVAGAFGIASATVTEPSEVAAGLAALWTSPEAPFLLRVVVDREAAAYPKIAFGRPLTEMEPHAAPIPLDRDG